MAVKGAWHDNAVLPSFQLQGVEVAGTADRLQHATDAKAISGNGLFSGRAQRVVNCSILLSLAES